MARYNAVIDSPGRIYNKTVNWENLIKEKKIYLFIHLWESEQSPLDDMYFEHHKFLHMQEGVK